MFLFTDKLTRNERAKLVIIKDTVDVRGRSLLKGIIKTFLKEGTSIYVMCFDTGYRNDMKGDAALKGDLQVHDYYSDPCGWISRSEPKSEDVLLDAVENVKSKPNCVIVVDSLSTLLFRSTAEKLYRTLSTILHNEDSNVQVLALLHADSHTEKVVKLIDSLATLSLEVLPSYSGNRVVSSVSHHPRGKTLNQVVLYEINRKHELKFVADGSETKLTNQMTKHPDPTASLTFNLRLRDDEKEVRSKLQLPYTKTTSEVPSFNEDDFYDEEDPDDDLDL